MDNMDVNRSKMLLWSLLFHLGSLPMSSWLGNSKTIVQVGCLSKHGMLSSGCLLLARQQAMFFTFNRQRLECPLWQIQRFHVCLLFIPNGPWPISVFKSFNPCYNVKGCIPIRTSWENLSRKLSDSREFIFRTFTSGSPMRSSGECCFATISLSHRNLSPVNQFESSVLPPWDP